ncbi:hypothetical protein [Hoeflea alexandrii]|uniref:Uncharacterized protein n=1 Tax=Hoeflea alexandrii TaxID=288436 RepID=A0ABT1CQD9_9HYPH|nr:hypothetical protein [Hoeflea alexandrii]MCO6408405.1 hypothetical protein [Hoeflea alexandrii]MCY0153309.1 hypothetical protein [Hoeflea alexandrii]
MPVYTFGSGAGPGQISATIVAEAALRRREKTAKDPIRRLPVDKPQSEIRGVHNRLIETKPIFPILLASKWGAGFKVEFNFLNSLDVLS